MKAARILSRATSAAAATSRARAAPSSTRCLHQSHRLRILYLSSSSSSSCSASSSAPIRTLNDTLPRPTSRRRTQLRQQQHQHQQHQQRNFTQTRSTFQDAQPLTAAPISDSTYHELADTYLDRLVYAAEELSESSDSGFDVEYSVCEPPHPSFLKKPSLSLYGHTDILWVISRRAS